MTDWPFIEELPLKYNKLRTSTFFEELKFTVLDCIIFMISMYTFLLTGMVIIYIFI